MQRTDWEYVECVHARNKQYYDRSEPVPIEEELRLGQLETEEGVQPSVSTEISDLATEISEVRAELEIVKTTMVEAVEELSEQYMHIRATLEVLAYQINQWNRPWPHDT